MVNVNPAYRPAELEFTLAKVYLYIIIFLVCVLKHRGIDFMEMELLPSMYSTLYLPAITLVEH